MSVTIAYADCFSGISGDMFLAALTHCGLEEGQLREELDKLNLTGYELRVSAATSQGISGIKVDVVSQPQQQFRHLKTIRELLQESALDQAIGNCSLAVFEEIARAEAKVHGIGMEDVHFHEVGAVDTIIDVVGTVAGLHRLGIEKLYASPLPMPHGFVKCAHGKLPLPAPAVCEILQGIPCYGTEQSVEMVTPTGAALLKVLAEDFGPLPSMTMATTGYGAGNHNLEGDQPNMLRLITGREKQSTEHQEVAVLETHLDDWNGEGFPRLCELLFQKGALDVSLTPMLMKKGRPGYDLQIIAPQHQADSLRSLLFCETTTIGIRYRREFRQTLPRKKITVQTPWGTLSAKQVETPEGTRVYPEYEECLRIAEKSGVSLLRVYDMVRAEAQRR